MTEKTSNYFNVDSLLDEAENTKYVLHAKGESNEPAHEYKPGDVAREFDEIADRLKEELYESYYYDGLTDGFDESYLGGLYRSKLAELNADRYMYMCKVGECAAAYGEYIKTLTDRHEKVKAIKEMLFYMKEHKSLIDQSYRTPWSTFIK